MRPRTALAGSYSFYEFVQIIDLDGTVRAQHFGEDASIAGQTAGVTRDGAARPFGLADLEHNHGLAIVRSAVKRGDIPFWIGNGFGEHSDHLSCVVIDHEFEIVARIDDRFVAGRHDEAETKATHVGE